MNYDNNRMDSEQGSAGGTPRPSTISDGMENPYPMNIGRLSISRLSSNLEVYDEILKQSTPKEKL